MRLSQRIGFLDLDKLNSREAHLVPLVLPNTSHMARHQQYGTAAR